MSSILRQFLCNPKQVGAIGPSSRALSRRIVSEAGVADARRIVEYGPGTGSFTRRILEAKPPGAAFCAIEHNAHLAAGFRRRFPKVTLFEDTVENVEDLVGSLGHSAVDCIVSGLPWAAFSEGLQDRLLDATLAVLQPGGTFVTFAYLQGLLMRSGKRFRRKLHDRFAAVRRSPVVWWNLPPAIVYRCVR